MYKEHDIQKMASQRGLYNYERLPKDNINRTLVKINEKSITEKYYGFM